MAGTFVVDERIAAIVSVLAAVLPGRYPRPAGQSDRVARPVIVTGPAAACSFASLRPSETLFRRRGYRSRTCYIQIKGLELYH